MPPRKRLGQVLLELGVIDEHQLQSALGHQKQWGGKLGGILIQKGFCAEEDVVSALAKHLAMQRIKLADVKVDPRALKCVSKAIAERLHVLPYEISGSGRSEVVTVAMSDPTDLSAVDQLAFHTGKRIKPMLAGDGEIIAAIHVHYGGGSEEKKEATDKVSRPGALAPAGSVAGFPKRIDPPAPAPPPAAAPSPAPARSSPYIPPPIPAAKPATPVQKLDEIEPDEAVARPKPKSPPSAVIPPLDLPEDDGQDFGLEPIAAHSQFGDQVAGREEVAGEGVAGDAVEGLVSASVAHPGAAEARQMDGLDAIAAPEPAAGDSSGWTAPIETANGTDGQTGWDVSAPAPDGGWGAEPAASSSSGWTGPVAADGWTRSSPASRSEGWAFPASDSDSEAPSETLPADAILGTAPILGPSEETAAESAASEEPAPEPEPEAREAPPMEPPSSGPPFEVHDAGSEADAPDAWASSEDPLASHPPGTDPLAAAGLDDPLATPGEAAHAFAGSRPASTDELESPIPPPPEERSGDGDLLSYSLDPPAPNPIDGPEAWYGNGDKTDRIDMPPVHEATPGDTDHGSAADDHDPYAMAEAASLIGDALDGGTPLSPADLGTLASIGVDPSDGVGALRLLAVLIRILNRNQLIEPGDLREEIRESQEQGAAAAAEQAYGMESGASSPAGPADAADT